MSDEKVVHLDRFQAHHIKVELLAARRRLHEERPDDTEHIDMLRYLIEALNVPERPLDT